MIPDLSLSVKLFIKLCPISVLIKLPFHGTVPLQMPSHLSACLATALRFQLSAPVFGKTFLSCRIEGVSAYGADADRVTGCFKLQDICMLSKTSLLPLSI